MAGEVVGRAVETLSFGQNPGKQEENTAVLLVKQSKSTADSTAFQAVCGAIFKIAPQKSEKLCNGMEKLTNGEDVCGAISEIAPQNSRKRVKKSEKLANGEALCGAIFKIAPQKSEKLCKMTEKLTNVEDPCGAISKIAPLIERTLDRFSEAIVNPLAISPCSRDAPAKEEPGREGSFGKAPAFALLHFKGMAEMMKGVGGTPGIASGSGTDGEAEDAPALASLRSNWGSTEPLAKLHWLMANEWGQTNRIRGISFVCPHSFALLEGFARTSTESHPPVDF